MRIKEKPENMGTIPDGNAIWDDYKLKSEMLEIYTTKLRHGIEAKNQFTIDRCSKRIDQYTNEYMDAEKKVIDFCWKNHLGFSRLNCLFNIK
jgi:hypothetical protein